MPKKVNRSDSRLPDQIRLFTINITKKLRKKNHDLQEGGLLSCISGINESAHFGMQPICFNPILRALEYGTHEQKGKKGGKSGNLEKDG